MRHVEASKLKEELVRLMVWFFREVMDGKSPQPPAVMLWGKPGVAKTAVVHQATAEAAATLGLELGPGLGFVDFRLAERAPTDLLGVPVPDAGEQVTTWYPPFNVPVEGNARLPEMGVLMLDELPNAAPTMQSIGQQMLHEHLLGGRPLKQGWFKVAAGNLAEDGAAVFEMPTPVASRFWVHYYVEPSADALISHAINRGWDVRIVAFLKFSPDWAHKIARGDKAAPTYRGWEYANRLLQAGFQPADLTGTVGEAAALAFDSYLRVAEEAPNAEEVLNGRIRQWPERVESRIMLTTALAYHTADLLRKHGVAKEGEPCPAWFGHLTSFFGSGEPEMVAFFNRSLGSTPEVRRLMTSFLRCFPEQSKTFVKGVIDILGG